MTIKTILFSGGANGKASRTLQQSGAWQPQLAKCFVFDPHDTGKNLPKQWYRV